MNKNYRALIILIKKYRIFVFGWAVLAIAACLLFANDSSFCTINILPYLYILAIFLLFCFAVFLYMAKQFRKINSVLYTDCDPLSYIEIYRDIMDELAKMKKPPALDNYRLNLSAGLIAAGRYDEAYESLISFKSFKNSRIGKLSTIVYYNNLCSVCLKLGKTDDAKYYLDCLAGCVASISPRDHQKYIKYVDMAQYGVNIAKGIYNNAENFYNGIFNKSVSAYEKVNAKFRLGTVHLHFGDTAKAREAFEYVIANGNKLYIVGEAKEHLERLV